MMLISIKSGGGRARRRADQPRDRVRHRRERAHGHLPRERRHVHARGGDVAPEDVRDAREAVLGLQPVPHRADQVRRVAALDGTNGRFTIPTGTAAGKVVWKDVNVNLNPGDQIVFETEIAATGAGAAGGCRFFAEVVERPEISANLSDVIDQST